MWDICLGCIHLLANPCPDLPIFFSQNPERRDPCRSSAVRLFPMAFRGRGRGRGGFARGFHSKEEPFLLFPADVALPDRTNVTRDEDFFRWNYKLQSYFENSPYFVDDSASQDSQSHDIERYSDSLKPRNKRQRGSLSDYMKLQRGYFPQELLQGMKPPDKRRRVKWQAVIDDKKLAMYEALERRAKENDGDEKDEDDEEENDDEEDDGEISDEGDYEQNEDFDDDEDDFNDNDDGGDEPAYD